MSVNECQTQVLVQPSKHCRYGFETSEGVFVEATHGDIRRQENKMATTITINVTNKSDTFQNFFVRVRRAPS
ncbi:hypothetical protein [Pyxidicoccus caerfyrddinensis]|uniref:hypothetical protein n=1 Tax=Pyxidicoccus caerfyrddinensis TaxID=2709663 RepID=UPI0013DAF446|nr:hypothetical protein [Pyxidicoccus caerfyrddinensis]